jgi:hypothetical protein
MGEPDFIFSLFFFLLLADKFVLVVEKKKDPQ